MKRIILFLALMAIPAASWAQTSYNAPSANSQIAANDVAFSNPNNAHADDSSYASATLGVLEQTETRRWTGFGFTTGDIPDGSTIDGIEVEVLAGKAVPSGVTGDVRIYDATNGQSATVENFSISNTGITTYTFGGSTSLWGETSFDDEDIRAATFGVEFDSDETGGGGNQVRLDFIRVRVYYTSSAWSSLSGVAEANVGSVSGVDKSNINVIIDL